MQHRIKQLRKSLNMTQSVLAEECGTSLQMIQYLENGQRQLTAKWLVLFSEALRVPVWQIFADPAEIVGAFEQDLLCRYASASCDVQAEIRRLLGFPPPAPPRGGNQAKARSTNRPYAGG